jgi:outer membrane protein assembly factor BamB
LYAVDVETGKSRWQFEASDWIWSQPEVDGDRAFFGDFSGKVFAVSLSSGEAIWDKPFDAGHGIRSSPALSGGTLIVGADNGDVFGLNPATGEVSWGPVAVGSTLQADIVSTPSSATVYIAPSGCIGTSPERLYYYKINTSTHEPQGTSAVC